MLVIISYCTQ